MIMIVTMKADSLHRSDSTR